MLFSWGPLGSNFTKYQAPCNQMFANDMACMSFGLLNAYIFSESYPTAIRTHCLMLRWGLADSIIFRFIARKNGSHFMAGLPLRLEPLHLSTAAKELSAPPCENKTCHVGDSCHQIQPKVIAGYSRCWLPYFGNQFVTFGPFFVVHAIVQATKPLNEGCSCQKASCYVSATRCVCCVCVVDVVVFSACLIDVEKTPAPVGMVKKL